MSTYAGLSLGATCQDGGRCRFRVWAPFARRMAVRLVSPQERLVPLEPRPHGYFEALVEGVEPGTQYLYRLDDEKERPDPASRSQPQGVHRSSEVVDPRFSWEDGGWSGLPLPEYVLYELHTGTFTPEGTFDAIIPHLDALKDLGVTAIELMPVAQFPGSRNWGYDGVQPFAVQDSYGGPAGLKRLVNACHRRGLAVALDVVYNHLGPEGNYLGDFGPYFTDRYRTPWGRAINFDGPDSDEVRRFFIENALLWFTEYHVDALRLDALHAIFDFSAYPFLEELAGVAHDWAEQLGRRIVLIAESDLNDTRLIRPPELGGFGLDAQWADDFHHALHTLLTGDQRGYYEDFGSLGQMARAFRDGYVYAGQYSPFRRRRHGNSARARPARQFVVFAQNHDQVGNRVLGERLSQMVSFEALKLAAGAVLLSPYIPMLFMGEEYGETAPFPYFISHLDPALVEAVRRGRREEFAAFAWQDQIPDPQDAATFRLARLNHSLRDQGRHRTLLEFYRVLLRLRTTVPALAHLSKDDLEVDADEKARVLCVRRWNGSSEVIAAFNFGKASATLNLPVVDGRWRRQLASADERWAGPGSTVPDQIDAVDHPTLSLSPTAFVLYCRIEEE